MKTLYAALSFTILAGGALQAQSVYIEPWPVVPGEPSKLYIDITSDDCGCPELQDADPETNPLYIWTWFPSDARPQLNGMDVNNGAWNASNTNLALEQDMDNPNLWYFDFLDAPILEFYGVDQATATGINFLLKESDGSPAGLAEQKSADLFIALEFEGTSSVNDFNLNVASFEVFPNPSSGMVRVKSVLNDGIYEGISLRVMTIEGRTVIEESGINTLSAGVELDIESLSAGVYMVQLSQNAKVLATKKLVVR